MKSVTATNVTSGEAMVSYNCLNVYCRYVWYITIIIITMGKVHKVVRIISTYNYTIENNCCFWNVPALILKK